jgi:hypothetical protein
MSARIVNNVKYIALMDDNSVKQQSLNDCIRCILRDVFLNGESESYTDKDIEIIKEFDIINYKKIYGFLNLLEESSFYFIEGPFDEDRKYVEYDIWWEQLQALIKKLENIIITQTEEETRICIYCKEIMTYRPQTQIMCKTIGKQDIKVKIIPYGWECSMKYDDCDIVFDNYDFNKNLQNANHEINLITRKN